MMVIESQTTNIKQRTGIQFLFIQINSEKISNFGHRTFEISAHIGIMEKKYIGVIAILPEIEVQIS
jgi:hypothetical protein